MIEVADKEFPEYNFKQHKGYGTKEHFDLIKKNGICKYHRKTFLKNVSKKENDFVLFDE
jgi:ribonuclease HII